VIGYPLETTIALSRLIFDGTLDRYPRLKIVAAHGGGFLPPTPRARTRAADLPPPAPAASTAQSEGASEYLKQMFYDTMVFTPEGLRHSRRKSA